MDEGLLSDARPLQSSHEKTRSEPMMTEADHILAQEEQELQQLIALMEQEQSQESVPQQYGSDDEDYDQIFMQCETDVELQYQHQTQAARNEFGDVDDMDMTEG